MIYAHGWWLMKGAKMSKSLGNVVRPLDLINVYGVDAVRYYLMRGMTPERDADFIEADLASRYDAALADDLGNLLQRVVNMVERYCDGQVPTAGDSSADELRLRRQSENLVHDTFVRVEAFAISRALGQVGEVVSEINRYVEHGAPWIAAKEGKTSEVETVLYHAAEALRLMSVLLWPVMPERMSEIWRRLGWKPPADLAEGLVWGTLAPGTTVVSGPPLFPKQEPKADVRGE